jgi:hypothetical protein
MPAHDGLRITAGLIGIVLLGLVGCSSHEKADPERALREAEARLQANDPAGAERILAEVIPEAPEDPRLRVVQARAELAAGNAASAEATLRRALSLGATRNDVAGYVGQAMLAQGAAFRAIEWVGDIEQWPPERQLVMAAIKAQAELETPDANERYVIKQLIDVFRRAASTEKVAAADDRRWVEAQLAFLREKQPLVRAAFEHFSCVRDGEPVTPAAAISEGRRILKVGPQHPLHAPSDAARVARDNDIIEIEAGRYTSDIVEWKQNGLLLRGVNGRPTLDGQGRSAEGIWIFRGNDIVVENVEFTGARAATRNGSGIRFTGRNLEVRDSVFHHNEDGILTWNDPESDVLVERSVFAHNGFGDGQSHNIYIGRVRSFTLRFSHSHDSKAGHNVKSRARVNHILYNRITDEDNSDSSYLIDLPEGGAGYVIGNILEKGANSQNPNAISYAAERKDIEQGGLWVVNNSFYNRYAIATFVANRSKVPVVIANNVLGGARFLIRDGPGDEHHNYQDPQHVLVDPAAYDFRLLPDSPLIDAGVDPGQAGDVSLWPEFEYVHPASGRKRQHVGTLDLGAQEFCGW